MISVKQAEAKLNISERRIRALCQQKRIKGAELVGKSWVLPDDPVILPGSRSRPGKAKIGGAE